MTVVELLAELRGIDAHIELDGERLRLNAPAGALTEEHRRKLRENKAEIVAFLRAARELTSQQPAIVPLQPKGSKPPIFAVAGHNGDVFCYRALAQEIDGEQPLFGLQPPGLEEGSVPCRSVEDLAAYFAAQIRAFHPEGPMAIAGFCAGGTVAFELARQLSRSERDITRLVLFGAPYCASYRTWRQQPVAKTGQYLQRAAGHLRALMALPVNKWGRYVSSRAERRRAARRGAASDDPVAIRRLAVEKATVAAIRMYKPNHFDGHLDIMLPCRAWINAWDAPLRWRRHAASSLEFIGPDQCAGDTMLLPEFAGIFAAFLISARDNSHG